MEILDTIKDRRTINTFKPDNIPVDLIKKIFEYGTWAPTHYMKEPWEVKLYQNKGKHLLIDSIIASYQRLGMMKTGNDPKTLKSNTYMKDFLFQIPHHALIYFKIDQDPIKYEEDYAAVSAFIQNSQLASWRLGVGMLWTITPFMHDKEFVRDIGLDPDIHKVAAVIQMGYPAKIPSRKTRTSVEDKVEIINE